jgi:hypothetical protein
MARSDDDFVDDNEQGRPPPIVTQPRRKPITRKRKARHVSTSDNDQDQPQVAKQPRKQTSTNNAGSGREESDDGQQGNDEESDAEVQVPPPMEKPSKPSSKKPRKDPFPRTALPDGIEPDAQGSLVSTVIHLLVMDLPRLILLSILVRGSSRQTDCNVGSGYQEDGGRAKGEGL